MNSFKKNQIIITALAIMILVAGYVNFGNKNNPAEGQYVFNPDRFSGTKTPNANENKDVEDKKENEIQGNEVAKKAEESKQNKDKKIESEEIKKEDETKKNEEVAQNTPTASNEDNNNAVGEAVLVSSNSISANFFLQSKIDREQDRAISKELILEVMNNENVGEEQKAKAASDMLELKDRIGKEEAAESMLLAKGFKDIFIRIDNDTVDVITNTEGLTETQLAQIYDIVARKTGVNSENIFISPLKAEN
jgi:stage III sporulation protein AH